MRERHSPRLCRTCRAPMARQEDTCWRCGTPWASADRPATALREVPAHPVDEVGSLKHAV